MKSAIYAAFGASLLSSFATVAAVPQGSGSGLTHSAPPPPCLVSWTPHVILLPSKPPTPHHWVHFPPFPQPAYPGRLITIPSITNLAQQYRCMQKFGDCAICTPDGDAKIRDCFTTTCGGPPTGENPCKYIKSSPPL